MTTTHPNTPETKCNYVIPQFYRDLVNLPTIIIPKSKLCRIINSLDKEEATIIYLIMILYYVINIHEYTVTENSPVLYGGRERDGKKGIIFSVQDLPGELLQIIGKYLSNL